MADNYTINEGTQTVIRSVENAAVQTPIVKLDVGAGTAILDYGEIGGQTGLRHPDAFGSRVSTASGTAGADIHGAVAGSSIYVTDLAISVGTTAMQVSLHPGGTANTAIFGPYTFAANGGMVANFRTPRQVTSGSALVYTTNADGTMTVEVDGYID